MTYIPEPLRQQVIKRADRRCEYCRLHELHGFLAHEIDHIYAEKHDGETVAPNLSYACAVCNRYKGSDLCSLDTQTGDIVALYHPRRDIWNEHFRLDKNGTIQALTAKGRVTVRLLHFNDAELVMERERLIALGEY